MFSILARLTTFYNSFLIFTAFNQVEKPVQTRSQPDLISTHFRAKFFFTVTDFHTIYRSVEMCGNYAEMYGNIIPILFGNSVEFRRKFFRTVQNFKFLYQNNFLSQHFYFKNSKDNSNFFT